MFTVTNRFLSLELQHLFFSHVFYDLNSSVNDKRNIPVYIPSDQNVSDMFTKANAVQSNGMNKELISRINGSAWSASAIKYRDHIRKIVKDNYTKENMVSDVPSAERLLELVL